MQHRPNSEIVGASRSEVKGTPFDSTSLSARPFEELTIDLDTQYYRLARLVKAREITHIINFAAMSMVAESWIHPSSWYKTNLESLSKLVNALEKESCQLQKFIHFTTPEVYGNTQGLISESWSFAPSTPYAISRAAGDWHLRALYETKSFPVVFTRAANVFGEHQRIYRVVPKTIHSILRGIKLPLQGGGKSVRSFIHIDDVSSALDLLLTQGELGASYHISTERFITIFDLVSSICDLMGVEFESSVELVEERLGKDYAYMLDSSRLRSELGWSDSITLESGLMRTIRWVKDNLDYFSLSDRSYEMKVDRN
jgi:dTDP-glucose 4,6-dehydratase